MAATKGGPTRRIALLAAGIGAFAGTAARGESSLDAKLLAYKESDGRTQVVNPGLYWEQDFGEKGYLGILAAYDTISGASPTGEAPTLDATTSASPSTGSIPKASYRDTRQAAAVSYGRRLGVHLPSVTLSYSHESDYLSRGVSLVDAWDLRGGASTLHLGVGTTRDRIDPVNMNASFRKQSLSVSAGWTQVMGPRDLLDVSLGHESISGYLTDPYKVLSVVQGPEGDLPGDPLTYLYERRPDTRVKQSLYGELRRMIGRIGSKVRGGSGCPRSWW